MHLTNICSWMRVTTIADSFARSAWKTEVIYYVVDWCENNFTDKLRKLNQRSDGPIEVLYRYQFLPAAKKHNRKVWKIGAHVRRRLYQHISKAWTMFECMQCLATQNSGVFSYKSICTILCIKGYQRLARMTWANKDRSRSRNRSEVPR